MGAQRHCAALSLLLMLLLPLPLAAAKRQQQQQQQRWQLYSMQGNNPECGSVFRDPQSKWLQSLLVVRARWTTAEAEAAAGGARQFNLTVTVLATLKPSRPTTSWQLLGTRIRVGEFLAAGSQPRQQRRLCAPAGDLAPPTSGFVLFLKPTGEPGYYRHSFLPVAFSSGFMAKIKRVACEAGAGADCARAAVLKGGIRTSVLPMRTPQSGGHRASFRLTCWADGNPPPRVRWLRDGVEIETGRRVVARFRRRGLSVASRLVLRHVKPSDAGNYSCQFANINGTASSSLAIGVAEILRMGQGASTTTPAPSYLCDSTNVTHCLNGGTCVINRLENRPHCICPALYSGYICEKFDASLMQEMLERGKE